MTSRPRDVPPGIRTQLDRGERESATLAEALAVDFAELMGHVLPSLAGPARSRLDPSTGITKRMAAAADLILEEGAEDVLPDLASHPSDTVRGWACHLIGRLPGLELAERLRRLRPLADDPHFGVREWAWLALRPHLADDVRASVERLRPWTEDPSPYLRRFASESTRPRGVWCPHIPELKRRPELGLPILEPLRSDPERYVQDSVGNWLNDASKSSPDWVRGLCSRWRHESPTPETERICTRAMRTLGR